MNETLSITSFLVIPLGLFLTLSIINVYAAIIGKFQPIPVLLRGLGGAIYTVGFGLCTNNGMVIEQDSASFMLWGLSIAAVPRLIWASKKYSAPPEEDV